MIRLALFLMLIPAALHAQLSLFLVNGTSEVPVGPSYVAGPIAAGDPLDLRFRVRNSGIFKASVTRLAISGTDFSIIQTPSVPLDIAPGGFQDIYVHFAGGPPASYSASFQVNTITVLLLVVTAPEPVLSAVSGCIGPDPATRTLDFKRQPIGQGTTCTLALKNPNSQPLTVSSITVTGPGFQLSPGAAPLTLNPGTTSTFSVSFKPAAAALYSGTLAVDTRIFFLSGAGFVPPLPAPVLQLDTPAPQSGQQVTLTMHLPSPSPVAASGSVNLAFQPDTSLVTGDPGIVFIATGARSVPFTIQPGATQVQLDGQPNAVLQTGTTSGKLRFTISVNNGITLAGDPTTVLSVPPTPPSMDNATATRKAGELDVQIWGFDNTYSAGAASFTFYDLDGKPLPAGAINADFTSAFRSYFTSAQSGSAFQMLVAFPVVTGGSGAVGSVDVQMTNSAGTTTVRQVLFR